MPAYYPPGSRPTVLREATTALPVNDSPESEVPAAGPAPIAYATPATHAGAAGLGWRPQYRFTGTVAKVTVAFGIAMLASEVASMVSSYMQIDLLRRIESGTGFTQAEAEANDRRQMVIGGVYLCVLIGMIIAFVTWFKRSYRNAGALGARGLRATPGWAVGYWFIPILNLFRPYQLAKEMWQSSSPAADDDGWKHIPATLVGWWWAAYIIASFASNAASRVGQARGGEEQTLGQLIASSQADIASSAVSLVGLVLMIQVVRKLTARQAEKFASQRAYAPAGAVW